MVPSMPADDLHWGKSTALTCEKTISMTKCLAQCCGSASTWIRIMKGRIQIRIRVRIKGISCIRIKVISWIRIHIHINLQMTSQNVRYEILYEPI
jgi:hypothetical protein